MSSVASAEIPGPIAQIHPVVAMSIATLVDDLKPIVTSCGGGLVVFVCWSILRRVTYRSLISTEKFEELNIHLLALQSFVLRSPV